MKEIFGTYGTVTDVRLGKKGSSLAYVHFSSQKDADQAEIYLDGGKIDGRFLVVVPAAGGAPPADKNGENCHPI